MTAAIFSIGTELTRGEIVNTNASWLAENLTALGLEVGEIECVADDRDEIQATLHRLGEKHTLIAATGGLGPTTDDITSECAAAVLGVPLERDAASLEAIRERMSRFGRTMAASNEKQADFPRGARVLANRKGTAPGFAVKIHRAEAFFLPGVPREMKAMFDEHVRPAVEPLIGERLHQVRLKTFGMTESAVNDRLDGVEEEHGVIVGYRAHFPEIEVKLLARCSDAIEAERRARGAADEVIARLGPDVVYGEGDVTLSEAIGALAVERGFMIGLAESCTGGLVAELFTDRAGSSHYFRGGVVAYSNELKQKLLGVNEALLAEKGAVSIEVARAMAEGALCALGVDVVLALTGIAGPGGGTPDKPVGLVHFAVATSGGTSDRHMVYPGSRAQVRTLAAYSGLGLMRKVLLHGHD
jgi:competence/damage-inducible protein CinA-like protein